MLVLDSGGLSRLGARDRATAALLIALRRQGLWPPVVPTMVLVESLTGAGSDANANRFLKICELTADVPEGLARRAASLRAKAGRGSAVDALTVATAEPGGHVLTSDPRDVGALAANAADVTVLPV
ncbi:MAG: hypothetical protein LBG60_15805 [Bifidobacteriaceae bacterium]|jgi:hypothetical protein|nr:hypothetical protein [Bifidobacteriaceae bacterium]